MKVYHTSRLSHLSAPTSSKRTRILQLSKSTNLATKDKYNSILIIVDKLIKYLCIIVCTKKFIAKQLKYVVLNRLIQYYNILKVLISNRDKLFTSKY